MFKKEERKRANAGVFMFLCFKSFEKAVALKFSERLLIHYFWKIPSKMSVSGHHYGSPIFKVPEITLRRRDLFAFKTHG